MHNRRARPTLRVIEADLDADWESPYPRRCTDDGDHDALHPLSELPHPLIAKATASLQHNLAHDNSIGPIACSTKLSLLEVKSGQWRGGVWTDPDTGVRWLVVAGRAKGGHRDRDDFYLRVQRVNDSGDPRAWLPTDDDHRLLNRETAARLRTEWELDVQRAMCEALTSVQDGGTQRVEIQHPVRDRHNFAVVSLTVTPIREGGYRADEVDIEIVPNRQHAGSALAWQLTTRVLIAVGPPEQDWDRFKDTYSNIAEPGAWSERVATLTTLVETNELAVSEPGTTSHLTHRAHLAGSTIDGTAVRALCGVFFVPTQDHDSMPHCSTCRDRLAELPD